MKPAIQSVPSSADGVDAFTALKVRLDFLLSSARGADAAAYVRDRAAGMARALRGLRDREEAAGRDMPAVFPERLAYFDRIASEAAALAQGQACR